MNKNTNSIDSCNDFTFELELGGPTDRIGRIQNEGRVSIGLLSLPNLLRNETGQARLELDALELGEKHTGKTPRRTVQPLAGPYSDFFRAPAASQMLQAGASLPPRRRGLPSPPARMLSPRASALMRMENEIAEMGKIWTTTPLASCILAETPREGSPPRSDSSEEQTLGGLPKHTKICRHFLRGHCRLGVKCDFLHDVSVFKPDDQKVFLGGLPKGITCDTLVREMEKQGYSVVNRPHIHARGFTPKVCIDTVERARALVKKGCVTICGKRVDVRRYHDKKGMGVQQRALFIGGLPLGITGQTLARALFDLGFMVRKPPVVRDGYAPKVEMSTTDQANALLVLGRVRMMGKTVDIRPWVPAKPVLRGRSASPPNHARASDYSVAGSWPPRGAALTPIASAAVEAFRYSTSRSVDGIW